MNEYEIICSQQTRVSRESLHETSRISGPPMMRPTGLPLAVLYFNMLFVPT